MSIILAQKAIQSVLRFNLLQLKNDINIRNVFLNNFNQFDATFKKFNEYAQASSISIDNFIEPKEEIEKYIKGTEFDVKLGYPRLQAQLPEICLVLGSDGEGQGVVGDIANETRDEFGNMKVLWNSNKNRTIAIHLTDTNPDALEILYQVIDFILVTNRVLLTQMGLANCKFDAGDLHPNQEALQSGTFMFERIISVNCDIYQTYETGFYGFSPLPSEIAMSSSLESEPDVNPDDLVDEVVVEETPAQIEDGLYVVGDQIPVDPSYKPLFRGASVDDTPTETNVTALAIKTFDQSIQGEFIFESVDNTVGSYVYFAYPKSLGSVVFKNSADVIQTFYRTDVVIDGTDYYVYRSENTFTDILTLIVSKP